MKYYNLMQFFTISIFFIILTGCKNDEATPSPEPVAAFTFNITNEGTLPTVVNFTSISQNAEAY